MSKQDRLAILNDVVSLAKEFGCSVVDVNFGWGVDVLVVMDRHIPDGIRQRFSSGAGLKYVQRDFDPHYGEWTSYYEALIDLEASIAVIVPRQPELLEAHKAELASRVGRRT